MTTLLPSVITTLRVATVPFIVFFLYQGNSILFWSLFLFALSTDVVDGYIARKYQTTSRVGAYYDTIADFVLIAGVFIVFTINGLYPPWILGLIVIAFSVFVITGRYGTQIYDPIGRYWGIVLYGIIALTVFIPSEALYLVSQLVILGFFLGSLVSRIAGFARNRVGK